MTLRVWSAAEWRREPRWRDRWQPPAEVDARVREIVAAVRAEGDAAVRRLTRELDGVDLLTPVMSSEEMARGAAACPPTVREALQLAHGRIEAFHLAQTWDAEVGAGPARLITRAVASAGLYVPGGRAAYPSTVLMTAVPARVAGVGRVVMATPPGRDGSVPAAVLAAAEIAGVDTIYRCGGAQAIAALAFGTESMARVDRIVGPGNVHVTAAKQMIIGAAGIDGIAGPSEVVVLADATAVPAEVALELAAQLEHDPRTWAVLITDSEALAEAVGEAFAVLLADLDRREIVGAASVAAVVCASLTEAVELTEAFAPEHLSVLLQHPDAHLPALVSAGSVFVGRWSPVPAGDYAAGPNHTLPTGGAARFASPLSVHDFLKRYSVLDLSRSEFNEVGAAAVTLADVEGLSAHARLLRERLMPDA